MKKYTHAWVALKAMKFLEDQAGKFNKERNTHLNDFLDFISTYPDTFVRGAWFPDTVIKDNTQGGHTWKYFLDEAQGKIEKRRPPDHNSCLALVQNDLNKKVSLDVKISDLTDRCEALSQMIRDTINITNKTKSGDVLAFNYSQVALLFLMFAHYISDAHTPVHCDQRDFNEPSHVHSDLEELWEEEVKKYFSISTRKEQFDLDEEGNLQLKSGKQGYQGSILQKCDDILAHTSWEKMNTPDKHWSVMLGATNNNFWDYLVSVCLVSFHMSRLLFPDAQSLGVDYNKVRILDVSPFKEKVIDHSPLILADAINSVALLWLAAWERWELLSKGIR